MPGACPGGIVCLLSALRFHGLTPQNPFEVWLAIDRKAWRATDRASAAAPDLPLAALSEGAEEHEVDGTQVRVFSAAKTVADCFKFRNKIAASGPASSSRAASGRRAPSPAPTCATPR